MKQTSQAKIAPVFQKNGSLSSQDNGARELQGRMGARPQPGMIGKNSSFVSHPTLMTGSNSQDMLGKLNGRSTK